MSRLMRRRRPGFTLIELLVALVLFDVALLAFAADAAALVRLRGAAARRDAGLTAALSRVARWRGAGCPAPGTGESTATPGVHEYWRVEAQGNAVRRVRDSVTVGTVGAPAALVLRSAIAC